MEDLFQILFILIFIVGSIVSSMRKKKKKEQNKQTNTMQPKNIKTQESNTKKQKSSAELLEELLGLKVQLPEPQAKEAPMVYSEEDRIETWDPAKEFEDSAEIKNSTYKEKTIAKKIEFNQDRKRYKAFSKSVSPTRTFKKSTTVQRLFSNPTDLKDYIIVQEILNKPKALRR